MLSHRNFVSILGNIWHNKTIRPKKDDIFLSYLPLSHIYERILTFAACYCGSSIGFYRGDISKLSNDIKIL